jgi:lysophospholipase L1-like esterase
MKNSLHDGGAATDRKCGSGAAWKWVPMMLIPFVLALVLRIFPIDRYAIGSVFAILIFYLLIASSFRPQMTVFGAFAAGTLVLIFICSTPFWTISSAAVSGIEAPSIPVFSYSVARANPAAFSAWWKFFLAEVVRTNAIIFKRDVNGRPDQQGKYPYQPIPNASASFYQGNISINNQGYRGNDFSRKKVDVFRILTIGDSTTFGQTLFRDSRTWSAALQDLIAKGIKCRLPIQVVNGGVNGYKLQNAIDRIDRDHEWLQPDMVLSYFGWNSMIDLGVYPTNQHSPGSVPVTTGRFEKVILYVRQSIVSFHDEANDVLSRFVSFDKGEEADGHLMSLARRGLLHQQYQQLIAQSRRLKYRLVLLSFNTAVVPNSIEAAYDFYQGPWPNVRTIVKQVELHNLMIRELAAIDDVHFIDTGNGLLGRYDGNLYLDVVHFTTQGDALMAANVYRGLRPLLLREKTLGCRPTF